MNIVITGILGAAPAAAVEDFPPDAVNDTATATSGENRIIDVLNNDSNPDDDGLEVTDVGAPAHGFAMTDGLEVTYESEPGYVGLDSFTYTVTDGGGGTDTATVEVTVNACSPLGSSIDEGGIVTGESWLYCSSFRANGTVGDMTPVMNMSGADQALLTTGRLETASPPNREPGAGTVNQTEHRGAYDVSIVELDLLIPEGANCLAFDLAFQTEEYPEFVSTGFNDGFLAELDVSDWSVVGSSISAPNNFAFDGAGNIVSVNSAFFEETRVVTETGTEYDGSTPLLEARTPIDPGVHTLYLSIFDATDYEFDSGAFVDRLRAFTVTDNSCQKGARQAPNALNDSFATDEDTSGTVNVLANDSDADGDPITLVEKTNGANGTVSCAGTSCTYTPKPNFSGTDSFTYRITDGFASDRATVQVTVNPTPDAPNAANDTATTEEDAQKTISVLTNDTDADGDPLTVVEKTNGTRGTVSCSTSSCTYTPDPNFSGSDSFTYTAFDGKGGTDTATVDVTVTPINDAPDARGDSPVTGEDQSVAVDVLANDVDVEGDTLTITSKTNGADGTVECSTSSCTYTPDPDFNGTDSFTYWISDGNGGSDSAAVAVTVDATQDGPDAQPDVVTTDEDVAKQVSVLTNDTDADGDALTVTGKTNGTNGSVSCSASACTYTPDPNFSGTDSFTYSISDGRGGTDGSTVDVTVTAVNDAPNAVGDSATTDEDNSAVVSVLANDSDVEGDPLTIVSDSNGQRGEVSCSTTCTYIPAPNFNGSDSFTYTVSDGNGAEKTATVEVTVSPVNDAPEALDDTLMTRTNRAKSVAVVANDVDVDDTLLAITGTTEGTHGSVSCADGSCTYTPEAGWAGTDSFTYTISDGAGETSTASVAVTVTANVGPQAVISPSAGVTVDEGQTVSFSGGASSDPDGAIDSFTWSVSDGRTATGQTASLGFPDNGTFDVTLEVCDDDAACDSASATVTVDNVAPTAAIVSQPTTPLRIDTNVDPSLQVGFSAQLTGSASDPAGAQDALTYEWDFGDGTTAASSASPTTTHAYKQLGSFVASLTVRDDDGGVGSAQSQAINVLPLGKCGKLKNTYWGRPGVTATVVQKTQFWSVKRGKLQKVRGAYIKPAQVVKLQAKSGSRSEFQWQCIDNKRYMRVEKVSGSLPSLNNEYLPESALLKLS